MFAKAATVIIVGTLGFVGMRLVFSMACQVVGHTTPEAVITGWATAMLTAAVTVEAALRIRK